MLEVKNSVTHYNFDIFSLIRVPWYRKRDMKDFFENPEPRDIEEDKDLVTLIRRENVTVSLWSIVSMLEDLSLEFYFYDRLEKEKKIKNTAADVKKFA